MKLILVMVTSLDGRSTLENEEATISSPEDQIQFKQIIEGAKLILMGSKTYNLHKNIMEHRDGRLRVIITQHPEQYENDKIENQLEFTSENICELLERLELQGFSEGYLVGGAHTNTEFFKHNLVNELWQTLEPRILGLGNGILGKEKVNIKLELLSSEKLNDQGTLLLKYLVLNS